MVLVPTVAAKEGKVVDHEPAPFTWYSILQVPVPPPLSVTPVSVRVVPAQTVASVGDLVAVGAEGSATTVQLYVLTEEISQPLPLQFFLTSIVLVPTVAAKDG